ncbi:telomere length regulation protein [Elasticomyces elasticus]|nr:telomere length regulation protein [Elasticomyces elasticus]KAK3654073.1 telomere length regulation protein [Elasticomyces elasticus]KAK4914651.1 telomere length regulation protein [Elasticomyces elasticus]KAK5753036.1 telomere length regulation protein [Elasticomyces elasticus]
MALKRPSTLLNLPPPTRCLFTQTRPLHRLHAPHLRIPRPTPFVPDVPTFLTLIGRNLAQHATKIPSWDALFALSGSELREKGVEPARARRYLLWWRERFRNGIMGIGGDLKEVKDGMAELRIVEVPSERTGDRQATLTKGAGMRKVVVNVMPTVALPADLTAAKAGGEEGKVEQVPRIDVQSAQAVTGVKIVAANTIGGTGVEAVKGHQGVARLRVQDGLWEERRGHKVDGGERRKAEVRYKRRAQERKNAR